MGNAAIPGFGIGRPVRPPELDPGAAPPLLISLGAPAAAVNREEERFVVGLLGAVLAIGSAVILAVTLSVAAAFAFALVILIATFIVLATNNDVVALAQRIDKAWANIDVVLKRRHDQLPNLVAAVRDVMDFEQDVLEEVTRLRDRYDPVLPVAEQGALAARTSRAVRSLFAIVENYPQLKSGANVLSLQAEVQRIETVIADQRELYNDQVYRYNARIAQVPAAFLAGLFAWRAREFFSAAEDEQQRPEADPRPA